jgi:hypothetical protein
MKKSARKLSLSKETLVELSQNHLKEALGGASKAETLCCPTDGSRYC